MGSQLKLFPELRDLSQQAQVVIALIEDQGADDFSYEGSPPSIPVQKEVNNYLALQSMRAGFTWDETTMDPFTKTYVMILRETSVS